MMNDDHLGAELAALERSAPTDLPPRPARSGRRRGPAPWLPTVVMVGVGVLLGLLGTQWLARVRPTASPGPAAGVSASPVAIPSAVSRTALSWTIRGFGGVLSQPVAIAEVNGRLIVTGSERSSPAAWFSEDSGASWRRASIGISAGDQRPMTLGSVTASRDRLLSLGWVTVGANDADRL